MDIRISTEDLGGFTRQSVKLDGEHVGFVTYETTWRAPKKWAARVGLSISESEIIGKFSSAQEAAFTVAHHGFGERMRAQVLATLGSQA